MRVFEAKIGVVLLASTLSATAGYAQAFGPDTAVVAVQPVVRPLYGGNASETNGSLEAQDSPGHPLAGAQEFSPDVQVSRRSYWQPFFNLTSSLDSNPLGVGNTVTLVPWASFYGGLDLHALSHRSDFNLNYLGGGVVSEYANENAPIQQLMFSERLSWRHVAISLFDQFGFFPEAVSPFNLPTGITDPSEQSETSVQPVFLPNQSILGTAGQELTNSFLGELDAVVTPRSSFTFIESFSVARFFNNNLFDFDDTYFQGGFNHQLTRNNAIALLYRFSAFRFSNVYQPMNGQTAQLSFGRRVTGRLAFQISAGPEVAQFQSVISPAVSTGAASPVTQSENVYATADVSTIFQTGRTLLRLGYERGVTDGAGFLAGAITDAGYGSIDRQLSRRFIGQLTAGYAKNQGLISPTQQPGNEIYRDWFGGVTLSHGWGRWASIFLSYQVQRQATNLACVGPVCGNDFTRHLISIGLTGRVQPRPLG